MLEMYLFSGFYGAGMKKMKTILIQKEAFNGEIYFEKIQAEDNSNDKK